jgi:hypothetical protein
MARGRIKDQDADVYGDFALRVMNSIRAAKKRQGLMDTHELEIVEAIEEKLLSLDPGAVGIVNARIRAY